MLILVDNLDRQHSALRLVAKHLLSYPLRRKIPMKKAINHARPCESLVLMQIHWLSVFEAVAFYVPACRAICDRLETATASGHVK